MHGAAAAASSYVTDDYRRREMSRQVAIDAVYDDHVTILYYYPGMTPDLVDALVEKGYRASSSPVPGLATSTSRFIRRSNARSSGGVHVVMTVQTTWGYAQMYVYDTGRDLLDIGVVPLDNTLPETALMKLGWVLGHTDDHIEGMRMMRESVDGEITQREPHNGYLILQGGLPETEEFVNSRTGSMNVPSRRHRPISRGAITRSPGLVAILAVDVEQAPVMERYDRRSRCI